jgi:DNA-binding CsgD family transcriptional regulator
MIEQLIDEIYEAAFVPECWPAVFDRVAHLSRTDGAVLIAVSPPSPALRGRTAPPITRWTTSACLEELFNEFIRDGWAERNTRGARGLSLDHAGFVTDADLFTPAELESDPLYGFLRSRGYGYCLGFALRVPTGDALIFDWERKLADGPVSRETIALVDPLRSHLARSALLSGRLGLERAQAATATLAVLGLPAAVISDRARVVAMNDLMQALMPSVLDERAHGHLRLRDGAADQLFARAQANAAMKPAASAEEAAGRVFSFPIPARHDQPALVFHVVPVRRAARDIFTNAASIVIVTPVSRATIPDASVIQGLFDLTATEARIARAIASGDSVTRIAAAGNTAETTVRSHLKAVFAKTGAARQGDLISMLANVNPHRAAPTESI